MHKKIEIVYTLVPYQKPILITTIDLRFYTMTTFETTFETIQDLCKNYVMDPTYVYKLCNMEYFIVMKVLPETVTNENRANIIDTSCAKCRASVLEVVLIVSVKDTSDRPHQLLHKYESIKTTYILGEKVLPDKFNYKLEEVCTGGIHYFKTIQVAFLYRFIPDDYTGIWTYWHSNGQKQSEGNYVNEKRMGYWIVWTNNGQRYSEGDYVDGKRSGLWTEWHGSSNGQINKFCTHWYKDGQITSSSFGNLLDKN